MFGLFYPIYYFIRFYAFKGFREFMCALALAVINSKRLFQLLNTFLFKSRPIFDHSSKFPNYIQCLMLSSSKVSASINQTRKNQAGFLLVIWQLCCWYMKRATPLSSWSDNWWSSWQYGLMLYLDTETPVHLVLIQTREMWIL